MPRYRLERSLDELTPEQIASVGTACPDRGGGVVWIRSYISEAEGKLYCEYDAPNAEAVIETSLRDGYPVHGITELGLEISPDMFH